MRATTMKTQRCSLKLLRQPAQQALCIHHQSEPACMRMRGRNGGRRECAFSIAFQNSGCCSIGSAPFIHWMKAESAAAPAAAAGTAIRTKRLHVSEDTRWMKWQLE